MEELEEDRLSSLPKIILHHILSRLPKKDAARTSVLSKAWLNTWYTFPILSFCSSKIMGNSPAQPMEDGEEIRKIFGFCDYVKRTLLRFRDQSLAIKEVKLKLTNFRLCHITDVDIWLKLACECGVEVIKYFQIDPVGDVGQDYYHVLPMCIFETTSLTELVLDGFMKIDSTFMNHSIKFFSLRVFSLHSVLLEDQHAINRLISFCPLIESITMRSCFVLGSSDSTYEKLKSLSISGLQKLKRVDTFEIQDVSIDAPCLETLCYIPDNGDTPFTIDFDRCRNLKELRIASVQGTFFTAKWFLELFPKFPFLESLKLSFCNFFERIDISSVRLKVLELSRCSNLKEVNIDAPNLLSCDYKGIAASEPTISFLRYSSQLEVNIQTHVDLDLCNLREFLQNIKPNNVLTSLSLSLSVGVVSNVDALDPVALQVSSPLPRIKHLAINYVPIIKYLFSSVVNILLSSCCPATISFGNYSGGKEFIELFYETLMRRKEDECFCTSDNTRCWWHSLKDVKVTRSSMKMDENVDFKTILESLPTFAHQESIWWKLQAIKDGCYIKLIASEGLAGLTPKEVDIGLLSSLQECINLEANDRYVEKVIVSLGYGSKVKIWSNNWLGSDSFMQMLSVDRNCTASDAGNWRMAMEFVLAALFFSQEEAAST